MAKAKVVFSDGSKGMAHNTNEQNERWQMRREEETSAMSAQTAPPEPQETPSTVNAQAPATGSVDSSAAPPSGQADTPAEQTPQAETTGQEPIRDPAAKFRADAEKWERLFKKAEEDRAELQKKIEHYTETEKQELLSRIDETAKLAAEHKTQAEAESLKSQRITALVNAGLDPAQDLDFITGTDAEAIASQVSKLAERVNAGAARKGPASRLGNAASGQAKDLSWLKNQNNSVLGQGSGVNYKE